MKIVTVIGARPQFIKAAAVSRYIKKNRRVHECIIHTGQHYDKNMSDIFFEELDIPRPEYNLGVGGGSHGAMTGRQLELIENVILEQKPDWVMVYGDTNSTLAGALASAKLNIPVAHVEAGLRSFNRFMPEEINRVLTDHASTLLLAPTDIAVRNLNNEGIGVNKIINVGDVMYDAALYYSDKARAPDWFHELKLDLNNFVLCTIHRAENTDNIIRLSGIVDGLSECGCDVLLPLHPRTAEKIKINGLKIPSNIKIVPPVSYLEMVWLESACKIIATDSGGVQKEAFFHKKPCVTLRDQTEWVELIDLGVNKLVGADHKLISEAINNKKWGSFLKSNVYGDGNASEKIISSIYMNYQKP